MLGVDRELLIHREFVQFVADKDKEAWCRKCLHSGLEANPLCEFELRRSDGSTFFAHLDCHPVIEEGAKTLINITLTDISAHKQAEETLRVAAAAFETQIGIMVTDEHKEIIRVNPAFTRITGYSAEEIIGRKPSFLRSGLHEDSFYKALWEAVAQKHSWQGELWDVRKNGEVFPVWLTITAISGGEGSITHYVGSFTDITLQKSAEMQLPGERHSLESREPETLEWEGKAKEESSNVHIALNILLKQLETKITDSQNKLSLDLEKTVLPFLKKIRKISHDQQQIRLIDILESNLEHLIQSYGRATSLDTAFHKLTPTEIQVATMVRQGLPSKVIASALNLSSGTIGVHRKSIRKKLGLESKADNLHCYLLSLTDKGTNNE